MAVDVDYSVAAKQHAPHGAHPVAAAPGEWSLGLILAWAGVVLAIALFNENALEHFYAGEAAIQGRENGPLENAQLIVMLPALALFALAGIKGLGAVRVAGVLLGLVAVVGFVRELDLKTLMGYSTALDWLVAHDLQDGVLGAVGLALVLYLARQWRYFWSVVRLALRWQAWPCAAAFALLAAAEIFLDGASGSDGHFWEELVEVNGYILLAVTAWRHASLIGDPQLDRPL